MRLVLLACLLTVAVAPVQADDGRPVQLLLPTDLSAPVVSPILVQGVAPGARVTVTVVQHLEGADVNTAQATFTADRRGQVDTAAVGPVAGTYAGREPLGLFWSGTTRPATGDDPAPGQARVTADVNGTKVASGTVAVRPAPTRYRSSTDTPFPGAVWARPIDGRRHPVVIVLGGSEGGSGTARSIAPLFAAQGYATLGLPYYDPGYDPTDRLPSLPRSFTDIPVNRLAIVRRWLERQPQADAHRIGIWGVSKGAEFALVAASRYGWIKAVTAVVPSDLVWEGWGPPGPKTASFAFNGRPLAFEPYADMEAELAKAARGERMDMRHAHEAGRAANPGRIAAARIPVERFRGRLLLIAGGRDGIWPSAEMAANIVTSRAKAHRWTQLIVDPFANHFLGGPGTMPIAGLVTPGSEASGIAHARARGWEATFALFRRTLH